MVKMKLDELLITKLMPPSPMGYTYEVEQFSPLMYRVWIVNHSVFSHTPDKPYSVWGFIKSNGDVWAPKTANKPRPRGKVCHISDIPDELRYSTIIPTKRVLTDD